MQPVNTLAYFEIFKRPLTAWELWRYDGEKINFPEFLKNLDNLNNQNSFYYLENNNLILERHRRYNITRKKIKRAQKAARLFALLPWVQAVFLANQIGSHNLRAEGDLDFFIITKPNRLWLSRFIITGFSKIFGVRPRADKFTDTFCLSFWLDADNLSLENFLLDNHDLYFAYWLTSLVPLIDKNNYYLKLINNNAWLKNILPNWEIKNKIIINNNFKNNKIFNYLENIIYNWQIKHLPQDLKNILNQDTRVVINKQTAKVHSQDRRQEFYKKYLEIINNYEKIS